MAVVTGEETRVVALSSWKTADQAPLNLGRQTVLVVEYDALRGRRIVQTLSRAEHHPRLHLVTQLETLVEICQKMKPDVLVTPMTWPREPHSIQDETGLDLLLTLKLFGFQGDVIVFENRAGELAVEDYCRPFALGASYFLDCSGRAFLGQLTEKVTQSLEKRSRRKEERESGETSVRALLKSQGIVGDSPAMLNIFAQVQKISRSSDITVLITGESGTGKQRLAEAIHRLDEGRRDGPFVTVNCSAIPHELAESELFGHRKGAFTGAASERTGYFRMAMGGTLLLDEIGDLPLALQPKLLRVLQEKKVLPLGADTETDLDVRVIAATNRNLEALVDHGKFRMDLYQRLSMYCIEVPPLRDRREDLYPLLCFFIRKYQDLSCGNIKGADPRVIQILSKLHFPGNVRQLEHLVVQVLSEKEEGELIETGDLPVNLIRKVSVGSGDHADQGMATFLLGKVLDDGMSLHQTLECCEKLILRSVLQREQGNRTRVAKLLKTTPRTLFNKIRKYRP